VGQLTDGKGANQAPVGTQMLDDRTTLKLTTVKTTEVKKILEQALTMREPSVDVRQFIAFPHPQFAKAESAGVPALFIYLLSIFSKAIIAQLVAEAGVNLKYGEPLGILTAQVFSKENFVYNGCPMIDILMAKFHVVCPVLWGFYGSEQTDEGKKAIGWWHNPEGSFVDEQVHIERMTGLGVGFAAIALRNFGKTKRENPYPNYHFWKALRCIVEVPPEEIQMTHLLVLSAILRFSPGRIIGFFGDAGIVALRKAIIGLPASLTKVSSARTAVELLRDIYKREKNIVI
jgi:nucleoporin GLE1